MDRYAYLQSETCLNPVILHFRRENELIDLTGVSEGLDINAKEIPIYGSRKISRILGMIKMFLEICRHRPSVIYAIYMDMLFIAVLVKPFCGAKIVYEIQDINQAGRFWRIIENVLMFFSEKIFVTSLEFKTALNLWKQNRKKVEFLSNAPRLTEISQSKKKSRDSERREFTLGIFGMIRERQQIRDIELLLNKTCWKLRVAGTCLYPNEIRRLRKKYPRRLEVTGPFSSQYLYQNLYPSVDCIWAVYPNTLNYRSHLARRFMEALALKLPVIVAKHAKAMIDFAENSQYVKQFAIDDIQTISNLDFGCAEKTTDPEIDDRYVFENYADKLLKINALI